MTSCRRPDLGQGLVRLQHERVGELLEFPPRGQGTGPLSAGDQMG